MAVAAHCSNTRRIFFNYFITIYFKNRFNLLRFRLYFIYCILCSMCTGIYTYKPTISTNFV